MKNVYVFMADGFEEVEALAPVDILRRAGADCLLVGVPTKNVVGARGVKVECDMTIDEIDIEKADMIVLPGGYPGFENLANNKKLMSYVDYMIKNNKLVGAICGAPSVILGKNGYLEGKNAVCYPGMEDGMVGAVAVDAPVVISDNIITSKSAATAMEFAFVLCEKLSGKEISDNVKKSIVYNG